MFFGGIFFLNMVYYLKVTMPWDRHAIHAQLAAQLATVVLNARLVTLHTYCKMGSVLHRAELELLLTCSIITATVSLLILY